THQSPSPRTRPENATRHTHPGLTTIPIPIPVSIILELPILTFTFMLIRIRNPLRRRQGHLIDHIYCMSLCRS
ncbi:uncharacterized protein STEHIDRAFT_126374, partial [Stereum hirsutum FP-91666 SS1]